MVVSRIPKQRDDNDREAQPLGQVFDDVDNEDGLKVSADDDRVAKLEEQLAKLHEQMDQRQDRENFVVAQPMQNEQFQPEALKVVPNYNEDLEGFIEARTQNILIADRNERKKEEFNKRNSSSLEEKVEGLWDEFDERYEDIASQKGARKRIEFVAQTVVERARARGLDPQRYMFVSRDRFLKDVATEYEDVFGAVDHPEQDEEDERPVRRARADKRTTRRDAPRRRERNEDDDPGRTTGMFGGVGSGNRPSDRARGGDDAGSMIDEIQSMQKKSGFF